MIILKTKIPVYCVRPDDTNLEGGKMIYFVDAYKPKSLHGLITLQHDAQEVYRAWRFELVNAYIITIKP